MQWFTYQTYKAIRANTSTARYGYNAAVMSTQASLRKTDFPKSDRNHRMNLSELAVRSTIPRINTRLNPEEVIGVN